MKKNVFSLFMLAILTLGIMSTSCKKDEETDGGFPIAPEVTASLDADHPNWVLLKWNKVEDAFTYNIYRSESENGEFEELSGIGINKESCTDKGTEYNTTYYYKIVSVDINFEEGNMPAKSVQITTGGAVLNPNTGAVAICDGEGPSAILNYVRVQWNVPTSEGIKEFKISKNGALLTTVASSFASVKEYSYDDENVAFGIEYTYEVVAIGEDDVEYRGDAATITPIRPEPIDRPVPEVVDVTTTINEKKVMVFFTDVAQSDYDLYEIEARFTDYTEWINHEGRADEFATDADGNKKFSIDYSQVNFSTGGAWFDVRVRLHTQGGWSDWSALEHTFLIVQ
ncbi:MAG: hypothetical protein JEZ03_13285 [Bacteroidales bacterium]|nr:hypothetical protein [Bacteroidales bacterium]